MKQNTYREFEKELRHIMGSMQWAKMKGDGKLIQALGGEKSEREHVRYLQTLVGNVLSLSKSAGLYLALNHEHKN